MTADQQVPPRRSEMMGDLRHHLGGLAELAEVFMTFDGTTLLRQLDDDPDDETVDRALAFLRALRDLLDKEKITFKVARALRGEVVGSLTEARPEMKMQTIAAAAGFNGSMASKVARRYGAKPRTYRDSNRRS